MAGDQPILGVVKLWKKARGKDPRYLAWKALDRLAKKSRKYTRNINRLKLDDARFLDRFRSGHGTIQDYLLARSQPRFFFAQDQVAALMQTIATEDSGYGDNLLSRADRICQNRIEILSVGEQSLGTDIDWQRDYRSGLRWELKYAFDYDVQALGQPSDVRIVWELSRLHFLTDLGKAYRWSNDEKYVRKFVELVCDWDEKNPYEFSVNWTCPMDVAIRAVNIIWGLMLVLPSPSLGEEFLARVLRMLVQHGHHIRQNLEYADVRNNHYLSDLVGLIYLGLFLPESELAAGWLKFAVPHFEAEISHEVYADGVNHEGTIPYHRLVVELFISTATFLKLNSIAMGKEFKDRLERSLEFVHAYVKPDGSCPMFGDADDGRLHVLGTQSINDHRHLLASGAVLFDRSDFKARAGRLWEEAAWLMTPEGVARFQQLPLSSPLERSASFSVGGFYFLKSAETYVCIDCGDVGMRGRGGHGHCDILSFEACFNGENVVVDRGCNQYTASRAARRETLVARSHNTILIDDEDYARVLDIGLAQVQNTPGKVLEWHVSESGTVFVGEHYGYAHKQIVHRRRIELSGPGGMLLTDELTGSGEHAITARFYLAVGCAARVEDARCVIETSQGNSVTITVDEAAGAWAIQESTVFPTYGKEEPACLLEWSANLQLPATVSFSWAASKLNRN